MLNHSHIVGRFRLPTNLFDWNQWNRYFGGKYHQKICQLTAKKTSFTINKRYIKNFQSSFLSCLNSIKSNLPGDATLKKDNTNCEVPPKHLLTAWLEAYSFLPPLWPLITPLRKPSSRHVTVVAALRSAFSSLHGGVSGLLGLLSSALQAPGEAAPDDLVQTFGAVNSSVKPQFVSCLVWTISILAIGKWWNSNGKFGKSKQK